MHEPRNFSFSVPLLALALTAPMAQAAPQAAPPAAVHPAVVHRGIVHPAAVHRFTHRRFTRRRVIVQRVIVQRVLVQPAFVRSAVAPPKVAVAPAPKVAVAPASVKLVAASKPAAQAASRSAAPTATPPDYGGRDSAPLTSVGDAAPNPVAQAGRALEALVVVLAGVAGVVFLLKRFDLVRPGTNGKPARISAPAFGRSSRSESTDIAVLSSQTLPGGTMLHVVRVDGKNLLLAATAQSVTTVTEWRVSEAETESMADEFEEYLTRADTHSLDLNSGNPAASGIAAANARLRSLLSSQKPEEPF